MSTLDTQMSFDDAAVARMIQSVGAAVPVRADHATSPMSASSREENNQASALMNVSRNLGGTFGISLVQTMLARRAQLHQAQYVESLNPLNPNYAHGIQQTDPCADQPGHAAGARRAQDGRGARSTGTLRPAGEHAVLYRRVPCPDDRGLRGALPLVLLMRKGPASRRASEPRAAAP